MTYGSKRKKELYDKVYGGKQETVQPTPEQPAPEPTYEEPTDGALMPFRDYTDPMAGEFDDISEPYSYTEDGPVPIDQIGQDTDTETGDDGRPSFESKYQQYIDELLGQFQQRGEYESPYAEQLREMLTGITGYGPYSGKYDDQIAQLIKDIQGRPEFAYDLDSDPAWQAYKKQYTREGQRAMQDTMGQYAALTGGVPSTAAMTAASQAGDYYNAQMTDKIPELYKLAYSMYSDQGDRMMQSLNMLRGLDSDDYARYADAYSRMLNGYQTLLGADQTAYGRWADDFNRRLQQLGAYQGLDDTDYGRYRDTVGDWERDRQWDYQKLMDEWEKQFKERQYEDTRKDTDWEKQFKEKQYGDSREDSEWEKRFKERQYGDSREDAEWEKLYKEWEKQFKEKQYGDSREDTEWEKQFKEKQYGDSREDTDWEKQFKERQYQDTREDKEYDRQKDIEATTIYAYRDGGGEPYTISSDKGLKFIDTAQPGDTMTGGDGSKWTKNLDGSVTITKDGTTWKISAGGGGSYGGYGGSGGSGSGSESEDGADDDYPVNIGSVEALGYGPISAATLWNKVDSGEVVAWVENGEWRFERADKAKTQGMPSVVDAIMGRFSKLGL